MSKAAGDPERAINGFMSVAQLLEEPRLARLYTYLLGTGEATIDDIIAELEIPRTTVYLDSGTLVDLGVLERLLAEEDASDFYDGFGRWSNEDAERVRERRRKGKEKRKRRMRERAKDST